MDWGPRFFPPRKAFSPGRERANGNWAAKFSATFGESMEKKVETEEKIPLSRLGRKPVEIPSGVKVSVANQTVSAEGPKGKLSWTLPSLITAKVEGAQIKVSPVEVGPHTKPLHGLSRKLVF